MESRREELKRRVQEAHKNPWIARRYGDVLKRAVTEYGRERQKEGAKVAEIARELGLSAGTYGKWLRRARLQIAAGKTPFEPHRRRSRESVGQSGERAELSTEEQPEPSEERMLVLLVKLSDVQVEQATREQLCAWLHGPGRGTTTVR
jgi:transposase-like protein